MKIFDRILLASGIVVAIGAVQNAFVVWDLSRLSDRIVEATTAPLAQVDAADRIAWLFDNADDQITDATQAISFVSSAESTARFKKTIGEMDREITKLSSTPMSATTSRHIEDMARHLEAWKADALVLVGDEPAATIVAPDVMEINKSLIVEDIAGLVQSAFSAADIARSDMLGLTSASLRRSVGESIAALLAGIGLSLMAAFSITRPMGRLKDNMALVAGGDLDMPIPDAERRDEIGTMSRALEVFRRQALDVRRLEKKEREAREREAEREFIRVADLQRRKASFQLLFLSNPVSMWVHDIETARIIAVNDAAVGHYGYDREQFLSMSTSDLGWSKDIETVATPIIGGAQLHRKADGGEIEVAIYESFLTYEDRSASLVAAIDLTERRRAEKQIRHLAHHDALTNLPNRSAFDEKFASCLRTASISSDPMAVLCLDLDHFKEVNNVFGHALGDRLLRELSHRLTSAAEGAFIARIGGDEFVVISVDPIQPSGAKALAERLSAVVQEEFLIDGEQLRVGLCIGAAIYPSDGLDGTSLLANADAALYRAKADGRGRVRFFEMDMDRRIRERRTLQHELRAAMERRELMLYYQPQAMIGGEIFGFEALIRWPHPSQGFISPAMFIPIAEESGLIGNLGEWVLREACREAASWPKPLRVAINLSPMQFRRGDLARLVRDVLLESGLEPERLEMEITEGVLMQDASRSLMILRQLKAMGLTISMDDFGTGYSSLSYLQSFPFDKIKIDQSFVAKVESLAQSAAIVRAVIGLGHNLEMTVIAEGVETAEQLDFLAREHCDEVQGYFIGRPKPIEDYAGIVGRQASPRAFAGVQQQQLRESA